MSKNIKKIIIYIYYKENYILFMKSYNCVHEWIKKVFVNLVLYS